MGVNVIGGGNALVRRPGTYDTVHWSPPFSVQSGTFSDASFGTPVTIFSSTSEDLYLLGILEQQPSGQAYMVHSLWAGAFTTFDAPNDGVFDSAGNFYFTNGSVNGTYIGGVFKMAPDRTVSLVAGKAGSTTTDGTGNAAGFNRAVGITLGLDGNLYVTELGSYYVRKVTTAGVVSILAGNGSPATTNGTGTGAQFLQPRGITTHPSTGDLYVADTTTIRKVTTAGVVTTFASGFTGAHDCAWDSTGTFMYVADWGASYIWKVTAAGSVSVLAGNGTAAHTDATGTSAQFYNPGSLVIDPTNTYLYVKDRGTTSNPSYSQLRRVAVSNGATTTIAGGPNSQGVGNYEGIGETAGTAGHFWPSAANTNGQLSWDPRTGSLIFADTNAARFKRVTLDGRISQFLGYQAETTGAAYQASHYPAVACYRIGQVARTYNSAVGYNPYMPLPYPVRLSAGSRLMLSSHNGNATPTTTTNYLAIAYAPASIFQ